jgi:hypothetical protein
MLSHMLLLIIYDSHIAHWKYAPDNIEFMSLKLAKRKFRGGGSCGETRFFRRERPWGRRCQQSSLIDWQKSLKWPPPLWISTNHCWLRNSISFSSLIRQLPSRRNHSNRKAEIKFEIVRFYLVSSLNPFGMEGNPPPSYRFFAFLWGPILRSSKHFMSQSALELFIKAFNFTLSVGHNPAICDLISKTANFAAITVERASNKPQTASNVKGWAAWECQNNQKMSLDRKQQKFIWNSKFSGSGHIRNGQTIGNNQEPVVSHSKH